MEADAFLTLFINQVDQVPATDGDYAALRAQRLFDLNEVAIDFTQAYDFSWLYLTEPVTLTAGESEADLPEDFDSLGSKGGVWRVSDGERLEYLDPDRLMSLRLQPGHRPSLPEFYSFFSVSGTIAGGEVIQTEILSATVQVRLLYKRTLPTITDTGATTDEFSPLAAIPENHQRGVIWAGMMAKVKDRENDFRNNPMYVAAKRGAIASDQKGKERGGRLASFFGD